MVAIGGEFTILGDAVAGRIGTYDAVSNRCMPLGAGCNGTVRALLPLGNGQLIAGGRFDMAGGISVASIALWDGVAWQALGAGVNGTVRALARLPTGEVVAGGDFTSAGGQQIDNIAIWNGVAWAPLGAGVDAPVRALCTTATGALVAGGEFLMAGGVAASRIAMWVGGQWLAMGSGCNNHVSSLAPMQNGDVVAVGPFSLAGGVPNLGIARWSGTWAAMDAGLPFLHVPASVSVVTGGDLLLGSLLVPSVMRWTGVQWVVQGPSGVAAVANALGISAVVHDAVGGLVAVGGFRLANQQNLVRIVGGQAVGLGQLDGPVTSLSKLPDGGVVVVGEFRSIPFTFPGGFARWLGGEWSVSDASGITAIGGLANGRLLAAGRFTRLFTSSWPWGPPTSTTHYYPGAILEPTAGLVTHLPIFGPYGWGTPTPRDGRLATRLSDGSILLGYDGGSSMAVERYSSLGAPMPSLPPLASRAHAFAESNAGPLAAGDFGVLLLQGGSWVSLGSSNAPCYALAVTPNGSVIVGGAFTSIGGVPAQGIAAWNGSSWTPLQVGIGGVVRALLALPNERLLAGGAFATAGTVVANNIARWDGSAWSEVAGGTNAPVNALLMADNGDIWVGGDFTAVGGSRGAGWAARLVTPCPASSVSVGSGCTGSGGALGLMATSLPWLGGEFSSRASGLPTPSLGLAVAGLVPISVPLVQVLPIGVAGCSLLTNPVLIDVFVPQSSTAEVRLPLPAATVLVGQVIYQQVVGIELDAFGVPSALTATNALRLVVGTL